ncbi:VPS37B subunit of ESCRT-I b isoform X2 [Danio aesculapii]|uniref:VPS37B subunit of ESCRT-I b isoform X2 n=1 Tax=Danio aesculapii TaxID=1142201 RepID=UPI0024BF4FF7|nr:VPS37B subunit of ESCRT-I b isoform X2 [Danio aesculapii]
MAEISGFQSGFSGYSSEQIMEILEDEEKLTSIARDSGEEMQQNKELMMASNRSLAEMNLNLQPDLDHQKIQLTKRYCCLQELHESYQLRRSTLGSSSLDTLLALLQTEGAKIEEETENMADSFLDGSMPLDSFIDDYQSKRKVAHLRRVKIDKLQEMLLKGVHLPQGSSNEHQESLNSFQRLSNGSPAHVRPTPTSQASASPYANLPNAMPSSYSSAYPQGPGSALPGFILQ